MCGSVREGGENQCVLITVHVYTTYRRVYVHMRRIWCSVGQYGACVCVCVCVCVCDVSCMYTMYVLSM